MLTDASGAERVAEPRRAPVDSDGLAPFDRVRGAASPAEGRGPGPRPGKAGPRSPAERAVTASSVESRWLFIVHPGETALYERLAPRLAGVARVVLDRRRGHRRGPPVIPARGSAYHLVYRSSHVDVYEVDSPRVPAECPECAGLEMLERLARVAPDADESPVTESPHPPASIDTSNAFQSGSSETDHRAR